MSLKQQPASSSAQPSTVIPAPQQQLQTAQLSIPSVSGEQFDQQKLPASEAIQTGMFVGPDGLSHDSGGAAEQEYHNEPVMTDQQRPAATLEKTTLWMGELEPWIDEGFVRQVWFNLGEQVNVKMIRDKYTGNAGYCFVDFSSQAAAQKAITYNGTLIPNSNRTFKLNWASGGGLADRVNREDRGPEHSIFVGDLAHDITEYHLVSLFRQRYESCKAAKIMTDPLSGLSRGYGFVRFADEVDQQRALTEMQGVYCGNRPMRISTATPKNKSGSGPILPVAQPLMNGGLGGMQHAAAQSGQSGLAMMHMGLQPMGFYGLPQPMNQFTDPNNTTVFVGGLSGYVSEDELRSFFQGFGEITYVKIPPGKGCGFVQFVQRHAAEMAINQMQGYPIGNSRVRLSWGRSQNNSGPAGSPYRPAPPPPVYASLSIPPQHQYSPFSPMNPQAPHHAQTPYLGAPHGLPGQSSGIGNASGTHTNVSPPQPDSLEPIAQHQMNEMYGSGREQMVTSMDNDSRQYGGIYAN
ncbi:hypothetical protein PYCC9005_000284 [Savitreella phatthalungensis]